MPRRTIFIFAAIVILLYFSIILFVLSPLHGIKGSYYGNGYIHHFGFRHIPNINWCRTLQWRFPSSSEPIALVSHPGSGNTWLRYLLQQVTGIFTGSIYMDYGLRVHGFPAENVANGSVLVVKTHELLSLPTKFKSAILLIRHPRDAILADFNRLHKGHIGSASKSAFTLNAPEQRNIGKPDLGPVSPSPDKLYSQDKLKNRMKSRITLCDTYQRMVQQALSISSAITGNAKAWLHYVSTQLTHWVLLHEQWLKKFPGPIHIVFYEALVKNTRETLQGILDFLNYTVTEEDMRCAMDNKEGIYRRIKVHEDFDPFTHDMYVTLHEKWDLINSMVAEYRRLHYPKRLNISYSKR